MIRCGICTVAVDYFILNLSKAGVRVQNKKHRLFLKRVGSSLSPKVWDRDHFRLRDADFGGQRKTVAICLSLQRTRSVRSTLLGLAQKLSAKAFFDFFFFLKLFGHLPQSCVLQSVIAEYFHQSAQCALLQCLSVRSGHPPWTQIHWACSRTCCSIFCASLKLWSGPSRSTWAFGDLLLLRPMIWHPKVSVYRRFIVSRNYCFCIKF